MCALLAIEKLTLQYSLAFAVGMPSKHDSLNLCLDVRAQCISCCCCCCCKGSSRKFTNTRVDHRSSPEQPILYGPARSLADQNALFKAGLPAMPEYPRPREEIELEEKRPTIATVGHDGMVRSEEPREVGRTARTFYSDSREALARPRDDSSRNLYQQPHVGYSNTRGVTDNSYDDDYRNGDNLQPNTQYSRLYSDDQRYDSHANLAYNPFVGETTGTTNYQEPQNGHSNYYDQTYQKYAVGRKAF